MGRSPEDIEEVPHCQGIIRIGGGREHHAQLQGGWGHGLQRWYSPAVSEGEELLVPDRELDRSATATVPFGQQLLRCNLHLRQLGLQPTALFPQFIDVALNQDLL